METPSRGAWAALGLCVAFDVWLAGVVAAASAGLTVAIATACLPVLGVTWWATRRGRDV